jgi:hypothetical protein
MKHAEFELRYGFVWGQSFFPQRFIAEITLTPNDGLSRTSLKITFVIGAE